MRLYLVRHGQTAWNAAERAQGHSDIPLDETGEKQAEALHSAFASRSVGLVLCSDLGRARQTAAPIVRATGAEYEETPLLRERGFGDWEGESFHDISKWWSSLEALQGNDRFKLRPPNGESFHDVWERIAPVVERLRSADKNVAVVSHGGTCGLLLAQLVHGTLETCRAFRFHNTAGTSLERQTYGPFRIRRYNDISHLDTDVVLAGSVDGAGR